MTLPNYPSPEVKEFGEKLNLALFDASVRHALGGDNLGGCKPYDLNDFNPEFRPYIKEYVEGGNNDSVAIVYAAMRTKELES